MGTRADYYVGALLRDVVATPPSVLRERQAEYERARDADSKPKRGPKRHDTADASVLG